VGYRTLAYQLLRYLSPYDFLRALDGGNEDAMRLYCQSVSKSASQYQQGLVASRYISEPSFVGRVAHAKVQHFGRVVLMEILDKQEQQHRAGRKLAHLAVETNLNIVVITTMLIADDERAWSIAARQQITAQQPAIREVFEAPSCRVASAHLVAQDAALPGLSSDTIGGVKKCLDLVRTCASFQLQFANRVKLTDLPAKIRSTLGAERPRVLVKGSF
jgi:hypothetical protein